MPPTSAYRIRIRTDSADSRGLMLFDHGELVAILMELADEGHGAERGQWVVETLFGLNTARWPATFNTASDAADWVGEHVCRQGFVLDGQIVELP